MTIGELIKQYRENQGLSQRQFALKCNISNGYISMLERGINPKTKEAIMPSITLLKTLANAMGISLNELFVKADDMPVKLSSSIDALSPSLPEIDETTQKVITLFSQLTPDDKQLALNFLQMLVEKKSNCKGEVNNGISNKAN